MFHPAPPAAPAAPPLHLDERDLTADGEALAAELVRACRRFRLASVEYAAATQSRANMVRAAFDAGLEPRRIAGIVGVSVSRVYSLAHQARDDGEVESASSE